MSTPSHCATVSWASRLLAHMDTIIPHSLIALLGRFAIATVFWRSGQTKVEGFAVDLFSGTFQLGVPHLADSTLYLFRSEYKVPLLPTEWAAYLATTAEHLFPLLLLLGLATRLSAMALLGMTLEIQLFVYPDAYPVHATWATILLYLMAKGPGRLSLDHRIARYIHNCPNTVLPR